MPRFRLTWKSATVPEANWHVGLVGFYHKETPRRWWIVISLRGILSWSAASAAAGFFVGTAALAYLWGRNPYNHVTYADLVLPTRWSDLRHKRGLGQVDEGLSELRGGKLPSAIMLLTHGVVLAPKADRGRFALAAIYIRIGYVHRAVQILDEGLDYGPPSKTYRETLFRAVAYLEDYERMLTLAERMGKLLPTDELTAHRWLLSQKVAALEKLRRTEEIEALHEKYRASPSFAVESAWARMQASRGNPTTALTAIQREPERFGLPADRFALEIALNEALGHVDVAVTTAKAWQLVEPANPLPVLEKALVQIRAKRSADARATLDHYFLFFADQPTATLLAYKRLSELDDPAWLRLARQETARAGNTRIDENILYVQGLLMLGQIHEAHAEFQKTKEAILAAKVADVGWLDGTYFLIQLLQGDSPSNRSQLVNYCTSERLGPDAFRFILRTLRAGKLPEVANEIAVIATNRFPAFQNDPTVIAATTIALSLPSEPADKPAAITTLLAAKQQLIALRSDMAVTRWAEARSRLRRVEQAGFNELQSELLLCRIEILGYTREHSDLTGALLLYLRRPDVDQSQMRRLATAWDTPELRDSALTLCRLVSDQFSQARWAHEYRKKLESSLAVAPLETPDPK